MIPFNSLVLYSTRVPVGSGTVTGTGQDIRDFVGELRVTIGHKEISTSGSTSIIYNLADSADNTTFAAIAGITPTTTTHSQVGITVAPITYDLDSKLCRRYLSIVATTASTTATFDVSATAVGVKQIT